MYLNNSKDVFLTRNTWTPFLYWWSTRHWNLRIISDLLANRSLTIWSENELFLERIWMSVLSRQVLFEYLTILDKARIQPGVEYYWHIWKALQHQLHPHCLTLEKEHLFDKWPQDHHALGPFIPSSRCSRSFLVIQIFWWSLFLRALIDHVSAGQIRLAKLCFPTSIRGALDIQKGPIWS